MSQFNRRGSRAKSSTRISVARHDVGCEALRGGECVCVPETSTEIYVRICANCGGELPNRTRPYCSSQCRGDFRVRLKNASARHESEKIHRSGTPPP